MTLLQERFAEVGPITAMEAQLCSAEEVAVIGGGNSAGQAAVFLSRTASHVHVVVRGAGLAATMSDYLVQRIEHSANTWKRDHRGSRDETAGHACSQ